MNIRVMGTKSECEKAQDYYNSLRGQENVKYVSISDFYPNRGSSELFRVYIDVEYYETIEEAQTRKAKTKGMEGIALPSNSERRK